MAWRGKDYFFRDCTACSKHCLSIFPPEAQMNLLCEDCFNRDDWDGCTWGRNYDFSRPFFDQFLELVWESPTQISNAYFSENCEYIINAHKNKDCYLLDEVDRCRDCLYGYNLQDCDTVLNSFYVRKSQVCYALSQAEKCYRVFYGHNVHNSSDSAFLQHCRSCKHCLFCSSLRNAEYHIFNKPVSKEQFQAAWAAVFNGTQESIDRAQSEFEAFAISQPVPASIQVNCEDCTGDQISNSKGCRDCYNCDNCQDCRYCTDIHNSKDCCDVHIYEGELMYECLHAGPQGYAQYFSHWPWFSSNVYYCSQMMSCKHCFGCSGLKHKEYCVFNKQYSKEEYEELVPRIIDNMRNTSNSIRSRDVILSSSKDEIAVGAEGADIPQNGAAMNPSEASGTKNGAAMNPSEASGTKNGAAMNPSEASGSWGEFCPTSASPYAYNQTMAQWYFPLTKEEALQQGFRWHDEEDPHTGAEATDVPDDLSEVSDDILSQVLRSTKSGRKFKVIAPELAFHRTHQIPLPTNTPAQRMESFAAANTRTLYDRTCDECGLEISTTYSPDRPEKVLCLQCYSKHVC